jgi:hypothetical protein
VTGVSWRRHGPYVLGSGLGQRRGDLLAAYGGGMLCCRRHANLGRQGVWLAPDMATLTLADRTEQHGPEQPSGSRCWIGGGRWHEDRAGNVEVHVATNDSTCVLAELAVGQRRSQGRGSGMRQPEQQHCGAVGRHRGLARQQVRKAVLGSH